MDDFCAHGQFAEGVRQHDRQLKTEQGLRARYEYARLGQHLLYAHVERRAMFLHRGHLLPGFP